MYFGAQQSSSYYIELNYDHVKDLQNDTSDSAFYSTSQSSNFY